MIYIIAQESDLHVDVKTAMWYETPTDLRLPNLVLTNKTIFSGVSRPKVVTRGIDTNGGELQVRAIRCASFSPSKRRFFHGNLRSELNFSLDSRRPFSLSSPSIPILATFSLF